MNIVDQFIKQFNLAIVNGWDKIYVLVDVHGTILDKNDNFFEGAIPCLQILSKLKSVVLILWTASSENQINNLFEAFKKYDINFRYVNENPEVNYKDQDHDFVSKIYCNVGIDDKFGFNPTEWQELYLYLQKFRHIH